MQQNIILQQISVIDFQSLISDTIKEQLKGFSPVLPKPETDYITRNETSQILGISLVTLNDWTKRGLVPSYRIASRIRYKKDEVLNSVTKTKYGRS